MPPLVSTVKYKFLTTIYNVLKYLSLPYFSSLIYKCPPTAYYFHPLWTPFCSSDMHQVLPHFSSVFKMNILTFWVTGLFLSFKSQLKYYFLRESCPDITIKEALHPHPSITILTPKSVIFWFTWWYTSFQKNSLQKSKDLDYLIQSCIYHAQYTLGSQ